MADNAGIAFGPLVTALLLLAVDWRLVVAVLAVPALIAAVAGLVTEFDKTAAVQVADGGRDASGSRSLAAFVADLRRVFAGGFVLVFLLVMGNGLYYRGMLTFLPELLDGFLTSHLGPVDLQSIIPASQAAADFDLAKYLYVGLLTIGIGGQYIGGRLSDRIRPERGVAAMLVTLALLALVFVPAARASLETLLAVSVGLGFALFAMQPLVQATIAKYSPPDARGLSFGYTYLGIFGVGSLGATVAGWILTYASVDILFVVLAGFAGGACLLATILATEDGPPVAADADS
nr:MFS transporter [Natrinema gelatinilyticum]